MGVSLFFDYVLLAVAAGIMIIAHATNKNYVLFIKNNNNKQKIKLLATGVENRFVIREIQLCCHLESILL